VLFFVKELFHTIRSDSKSLLPSPVTLIVSLLEFLFLKALAEKNIEKMKETIDMMMMPKIAKALVKDRITNYSFYLHIYVIIYAKIALLHGFDLGIDNEVAPKEIIDNTPLESYEDPYDFMKKFDLKTITQKEWREWTESYSTFIPID